MTYSSTTICNIALVKIGASQITNLGQANSAPAAACEAVYDHLRDELLRGHNWGFAMQRGAVTLLDDAPESEKYFYQFQLPANPKVMRVVDVPDYPKMDYRIEQDKILCNETTLIIRYIKEVTDENLFPPDFVGALACRIAAEVAIALTNSATLRQQMMIEYHIALSEAKGNGAIEVSPEVVPDTWADR